MERKENTAWKILPFYAVQLRDLVAPKAILHAECRICRRVGDLDPLELAWKLGPQTSAGGLQRLLRCNGYATGARPSSR
jgi:hypothetical protein